MEPNTFPQLQLWCPRPFGTYSQNKPCPAAPSSARKHLPYHSPTEETSGAQPHSENIPPPPPPPPPAAAAAAAAAPPAPTPATAASLAEEGRVLLDTWYVIKPGNTKEKVAFFVAHQCGGTAGGSTTTTTTSSSTCSSSTTNRASTMKVKGNWASDSSKAKRRRRCHHPSKGKLVATSLPGEAPGEAADLLSVAEMVALVEQRTALALQSFPARACGSGATTTTTSSSSATPSSTPLVFVEASSEDKGPSSSDCSRVAEAVARFESRHRGAADEDSGGSLCHHSPACATSSSSTSTTTPSSTSSGGGEVRIAFRISSAFEAGEASGVAAGRGSCVLMGAAAAAAGAGGGHGKDKITCDLYQLISPSRDALPSNVEFLLASAGVKGDAEGRDVEMGAGEGSGSKGELGEGGGGAAEELLSSSSSSSSSSAAARDCSSGFHVDVVVTGVVDQCVFFGKDSAKKMKEETVRLPTQEDPPPGQLFLFPVPEELPAAPEAATAAGEEAAGGSSSSGGGGGDPSLCRLYRHVSHDFLEIRFKIQRLLEPRQYMLLLPDHVMVKIFSYLPTQSLAALKCSCHYFKSLIETFGVRAADSRWSRDPSYRDDPCKQCKKRYQRGDVSLCRWHPKPYHHDLPYGRSYWMCCRRGDKEAPGCRLGLHDNNWVAPREGDGR